MKNIFATVEDPLTYILSIIITESLVHGWCCQCYRWLLVVWLQKAKKKKTTVCVVSVCVGVHVSIFE